MCSSKTRVHSSFSFSSSSFDMDLNVAKINGRPVLQPTCNHVPSLLERRNSLKKPSKKLLTSLASPLPSPKGARTRLSPSPPISPKPKSPKVVNHANGSRTPRVVDKVQTNKSATKISTTLPPNKSSNDSSSTHRKANSIILVKSGTIAAARREQVANLQAMRKMRTAHYGRVSSSKNTEKVVPFDISLTQGISSNTQDKTRCGFISANSDPIYVAYHDEEWGVPQHDDEVLFELLVLTVAQVGSDWTTVLKKRQHFRNAFSDFDAEVVAEYNERKIASICSEYDLELSKVRGAIDNANQIIKIKEQFGSLDKYLWSFVNHKSMSTNYKSCQKIPVKTSKSETISKDMIKRGFRFVGPAVIHSLMQAAGLTNDHLVSCPRHSYCMALAK